MDGNGHLNQSKILHQLLQEAQDTSLEANTGSELGYDNDQLNDMLENYRNEVIKNRTQKTGASDFQQSHKKSHVAAHVYKQKRTNCGAGRMPTYIMSASQPCLFEKPQERGNDWESEGNLASENIRDYIKAIEKENASLNQRIVELEKKSTKLEQLEISYRGIEKEYEQLLTQREKQENIEKSIVFKLQQHSNFLTSENERLREQNSILNEVISQRYKCDNVEQLGTLIEKFSPKNKQLLLIQERQKIELEAQMVTLEEQRAHIEVLEKALANAQERLLSKERQALDASAVLEKCTNLQKTLQESLDDKQKCQDMHNREKIRLEMELAQLRIQLTKANAASEKALTPAGISVCSLPSATNKDERINQLEANIRELQSHYINNVQQKQSIFSQQPQQQHNLLVENGTESLLRRIHLLEMEKEEKDRRIRELVEERNRIQCKCVNDHFSLDHRIRRLEEFISNNSSLANSNVALHSIPPLCGGGVRGNIHHYSSAMIDSPTCSTRGLPLPTPSGGERMTMSMTMSKQNSSSLELAVVAADPNTTETTTSTAACLINSSIVGSNNNCSNNQLDGVGLRRTTFGTQYSSSGGNNNNSISFGRQLTESSSSKSDVAPIGGGSSTAVNNSDVGYVSENSPSPPSKPPLTATNTNDDEERVFDNEDCSYLNQTQQTNLEDPGEDKQMDKNADLNENTKHNTSVLLSRKFHHNHHHCPSQDPAEVTAYLNRLPPSMFRRFTGDDHLEETNSIEYLPINSFHRCNESPRELLDIRYVPEKFISSYSAPVSSADDNHYLNNINSFKTSYKVEGVRPTGIQFGAGDFHHHPDVLPSQVTTSQSKGGPSSTSIEINGSQCFQSQTSPNPSNKYNRLANNSPSLSFVQNSSNSSCAPFPRSSAIIVGEPDEKTRKVQRRTKNESSDQTNKATIVMVNQEFSNSGSGSRNEEDGFAKKRNSKSNNAVLGEFERL